MSAKRVDPTDGLAYTYEEIAAYYEDKYKKKAIEAYWETLEPISKSANCQAKAKSKEEAAPETQSKAKAEAKAQEKAEVLTQTQFQQFRAELLDISRSAVETKFAELAECMGHKMYSMATNVAQTSKSVEYLQANLCRTYAFPYADGPWDMQPVGNNQRAVPERQRGNRPSSHSTELETLKAEVQQWDKKGQSLRKVLHAKIKFKGEGIWSLQEIRTCLQIAVDLHLTPFKIPGMGCEEAPLSKCEKLKQPFMHMIMSLSSLITDSGATTGGSHIQGVPLKELQANLTKLDLMKHVSLQAKLVLNQSI